MSRKDYIKAAAIIRDTNAHKATDENFREGWHAATSSIAHKLADVFESDNANFDRKRFFEACGISLPARV